MSQAQGAVTVRARHGCRGKVQGGAAGRGQRGRSQVWSPLVTHLQMALLSPGLPAVAQVFTPT